MGVWSQKGEASGTKTGGSPGGGEAAPFSPAWQPFPTS